MRVESSDAELLMRFVRHRDEAAFEELVQKHSSLVLGTCQQILRNQHDAEDAFQATFLILVRRCRSIRNVKSLSSWLYRVAYRTAMRSAKTRRDRGERMLQDRPAAEPDPFDVIQEREARRVLLEELNRLPARFQLPLILCYLDGKSQSEVAEELDCTDTAVKGRLAKGRKLLRTSLLRRGVALSCALHAINVSMSAATAASPNIAAKTVSSCLAHASRGAYTSISDRAVHLTREGTRHMAILAHARSLAAAVILGVVGVLALCALGFKAPSLAAQPRASIATDSAVADEKTDKDNLPVQIQVSNDEQGIVGRWKVVSAIMYGKESKSRVGLIWEFKDDKQFAIHYPSGHTLEGNYRLKLDRKAMYVDVETSEDRPEFGGGGPRKGIVAIEGDRLTLCVTGGASAPRPKEMASATGSLNILRVMKREKHLP